VNLYPSIDLRGGKCVRLLQGDFDREIVYGDDPIAVAKAYEAAGAPWIHVVDLDASRRQGSNRDAVVEIAGAVGVPVQAGGGVVDDSLLQRGVARVVVGSAAIDRPDEVRALASAWPGRVAVGLDHRDGEVRVRGWEDATGVDLWEAAASLAFHGVAAFVVTAIARDGLLAGPDIDGLMALLGATEVPVVASGGVGVLDDLRALAAVESAGRRLDGAIVGRALYEGLFTIEEAVAACRP
jgi:phosphoribosylformimino-5-aminoimidazole carboxamide ribotide isomerase